MSDEFIYPHKYTRKVQVRLFTQLFGMTIFIVAGSVILLSYFI